LAFDGKVFPFKPSLIAVGIPPTFVARDGTPNELASAKTTPNAFVAETKFILRNSFYYPLHNGMK
jgi:hypothetical protein